MNTRQFSKSVFIKSSCFTKTGARLLHIHQLLYKGILFPATLGLKSFPMHSPQICVLGSGVLVEVNNHEYIDFVFYQKKVNLFPKNEAFAVWVVKETLKQSRSFQALLHCREKTLLQGCAKHGCLNILIFLWNQMLCFVDMGPIKLGLLNLECQF